MWTSTKSIDIEDKLNSSKVNEKISAERRKVRDWLSNRSSAEEFRIFTGEDLFKRRERNNSCLYNIAAMEITELCRI